uniref:VARL domain protein n=1 Tax=Yamagishiella unicocca TaxID=51707 RepID=A0A1W6R6L2_9CHLO|nr:VARL domain protein [Yamagishiella unicocca]
MEQQQQQQPAFVAATQQQDQEESEEHVGSGTEAHDRVPQSLRDDERNGPPEDLLLMFASQGVQTSQTLMESWMASVHQPNGTGKKTIAVQTSQQQAVQAPQQQAVQAPQQQAVQAPQQQAVQAPQQQAVQAPQDQLAGLGGPPASGSASEIPSNGDESEMEEVVGANDGPGNTSLLKPPERIEVTVAVLEGPAPRGGRGQKGAAVRVPVYVKGPVCGEFDVARYVAGGECIYKGSRWVSRSSFVKESRNTKAKWYFSIRVLPDLEMLGDWLQRHRLPVPKGAVTRSSKRAAEGSGAQSQSHGQEAAGGPEVAGGDVVAAEGDVPGEVVEPTGLEVRDEQRQLPLDLDLLQLESLMNLPTEFSQDFDFVLQSPPPGIITQPY